ncbi:MAG: ABC transporter permease [Butyrivibrio sp.]|nr:ABC transporter permease [Butyrivibrio sp.]
MRNIGEYLKSAIKQMKHNGSKTIMTMLGIIIGIAAVIIVVGLGNGLTNFVRDSINGIMGAYGAVYIDTSKTSEAFDADDVKLVEDTVDNLGGISPIVQAAGKVKGPRGNCSTEIYSGNESLMRVFANKIIKGQYFTRQQVETAQRVCVMKEDDAMKLFGTTECIGREIEITVDGKSADYTVVGVREKMNSYFDLATSDYDYFAMIEVPYTIMGDDFGYNINKLDQLLVFADQDKLQQVLDDAKEVLTVEHGLRGSDAILAYNVAGENEKMLNEEMGFLSKFLVAVAVISLIVGGIGIMNIMLVSVTERTREIGIRKSIGARTEAVMAQFLSESALITLIGGSIGILIGAVLSAVISAFTPITLTVSPGAILGTVTLSVVIGVFFGIYPANKAAKMKPIDALRV